MSTYQTIMRNRKFTETVDFILGIFIYAVGFNVFVMPMGLYSGGFMGISQLIVYAMKSALHIPIPAGLNLTGVIYFVLNIPLFYLGFRVLGGKFTLRTLITVGLQSLFFLIIPIPKVPLVEDYLTACIIGGIVTGGGCGLILRGRASSGGQDIIGLCLVKKKPDFSVGKIGILMNLFIYGICLLIFNIEIVIYSLIYATILSLIVDRVHTQNINTGVMIFTKRKGTARILMEQVGRGVTYWEGKGAYSNKDAEILYVVASKYEASHIKDVIREIDPAAFVIFTDGCSIEGNFEKRL